MQFKVVRFKLRYLSMFYLVISQDGSYSRGPVDIPVGEANESNYYLSPTLKFEQVSCFFCSSFLILLLINVGCLIFDGRRFKFVDLIYLS